MGLPNQALPKLPKKGRINRERKSIQFCPRLVKFQNDTKLNTLRWKIRSPKSFTILPFCRLDRPLWLKSGARIRNPKLQCESSLSPWAIAIASMSAAYQGHLILCSQVKRRSCLFTDVFGTDIGVARALRHPRLDQLIGRRNLLQMLPGITGSDASCEGPVGKF